MRTIIQGSMCCILRFIGWLLQPQIGWKMHNNVSLRSHTSKNLLSLLFSAKMQPRSEINETSRLFNNELLHSIAQQNMRKIAIQFTPRFICMVSKGRNKIRKFECQNFPYIIHTLIRFRSSLVFVTAHWDNTYLRTHSSIRTKLVLLLDFIIILNSQSCLVYMEDLPIS